MKFDDLIIGNKLKVLNYSGGCATCPRKVVNYLPAALRDTKVIIVGEFPRETDIKVGEHFSGTSGQFLREQLTSVGITEYSVTNIIQCNPPGNKEPTEKEISCCMNQYTTKDVLGYPIVVLVGNTAISSFFPGERAKNLRNNVVWHPDYPGQRFFCINDPIWVMANKKKKEWKEALERLVRIINEDGTPSWKIVHGDMDKLEEILSHKYFSFDIETNAESSWIPSSRIKSFAVCSNEHEALFFHEDDIVWKQALLRVGIELINPTKLCIGQNIGFDIEFMEKKLGIVSKCKLLDIMSLYYILKQERMASLKYLTSEYLDGYRFLVPNPDKCDDTLLLSWYNTEDIIRALQLAKKGLKELSPKQKELLLRVSSPSSLALQRLSATGFYFDLEEATLTKKGIQEEREKIYDLWKKSDPVFNPDVHLSGEGLIWYLYTHKNLPVLQVTGKKQRPSTDKHVLAQLHRKEKAPFLDWLSRLTVLEKNESTFLDRFLNGELLSSDNRIHSSYFHTFTKTARSNSRAPNCFDATTDILTTEGWVPFPELTDNHKVAQYDKITKEISFTLPERVIRQPYTGELVHFDNQQISLAVTPEHRILLETRRSNRCFDVLAGEMSSSYWDCKYPQAGIYVGGNNCYNLTENKIRLLVAIQADGSYHDGGIGFIFHKQRKAERLLQLLNIENLPYSYNVYGNRHRIRILSDGIQTAEWITLLGKEKCFGWWVLSLSQHLLNTFVEELWYWDGSFTRKNNYSSSIRKNADVVQAALVLSGRRARMRPYLPPSNKVNWQVDTTIKKRDYTMTTNLIPRREAYSGNVYCVTVPTGYVVVRRASSDGRVKVSISGNCQNVSRDDSIRKSEIQGISYPLSIRKLYSVPKGSLLLGADFSQLELRLAMALANDPVGLDAYKTGGDLHTITATMIAAGEGRTVTKLDRTYAKPVNFGLIYCHKNEAYTLRKNAVNNYGINLSEYQAEEYANIFLETYRRIRPWQNEQVLNLRANKGWAETVLGHRWYYPDYNSPDKNKRDAAEREAINLQCQSPAGHITLYTLYNYQQELLTNGLSDVKVVGSVHDSILSEIPSKDLVKPAIECLQRSVDTVRQWISPWFPIPLVMDFELGTNWSNLQKISGLDPT